MIASVICTLDRTRELADALRSLLEQTLIPERIVVVNAGDPIRVPDGVHVIASSPGLPRQRNAGLAAVWDSDFVAFFDDDVVLEPTYIEEVVGWFATHPDAVGVGGAITNDVGFSSANRLYRALFALAQPDGVVRPSGEALYRYLPSEPVRVDVISGSNMTWRTSALVDVRFDESLHGYAYAEDAEFCLSIGDRGEIWTIPTARLTHERTRTSRVPRREYVAQVLANGAYIFAKHRRAHGFSRAAFCRRLLGRSLGFGLQASRALQLEPVQGLAAGWAAVPRALRRGSAAAERHALQSGNRRRTEAGPRALRSAGLDDGLDS